MRFVLFTTLILATAAHAQVSPDTESKVAAIAERVLHDTGVPSASIAFAQNGKVVYAKAFGLARVAPAVAAEPSMAYPIGSISKQFTASAVLLLAQQGKLSLDDKVARFYPELTRANDVSLRNLLTMTSGYQDFAPQDYIIPAWLKATDPSAIVHEWATKPLDFEPGTEWQYSNTNYVLVALIVQKVSGQPFAEFIRQHVLTPAGIEHVVDTYAERDKLRVTGYVSFALQPVREQPLEGNGWYFGDGDLAMPASSLVAWDLCMVCQCLLSPASYTAMETPFLYTSGKDKGKDSQYGLGIRVVTRDGVHYFEHGGEVGGFVAENIVFPERNAAIAVLTNEVASSAASQIAKEIMPLVLGDVSQSKPAEVVDPFADKLKLIMAGLAQGHIDHSLFTANAISYFDALALADFKAELAPLGVVTAVTRTRTSLRGGMTFGLYRVTFANGTTLLVDDYVQPDGKIEQLLIVGKADSAITDPAQPTGPPRRVRISGGVAAGNIRSKVDLKYPAEARAAHVSGSVVLHAIIGKDGTVQSLTVISGPEELRASSIDAVRQWTYKPYLLNGEPVEVETTILLNYNLAP